MKGFYITVIVSILIWFVFDFQDKLTQNQITKKTKTILPGQKYLFSYSFDSTTYEGQNPFKFPEIDTVIVLEIKKDYVKYGFMKGEDTSFTTSGKLRYFVQNIKPFLSTVSKITKK